MCVSVQICAISFRLLSVARPGQICIYVCFSRFAAIAAQGCREFGFVYSFGLQVGKRFENFYTIDLNSAQSKFRALTHTLTHTHRGAPRASQPASI